MSTSDTTSAKYLGTLEVLGREIGWTVSRSGIFEADVSGDRVWASSLAELETRAKAAVAKQRVKVAVKVSIRTAHSLENATLTGIHARTKEITIRWDDGRADTVQAHDYAYRPVTAAEQETFATLLRAKTEASAALEAFIAERGIYQGAISKHSRPRSLSDLVHAATEAALAAKRAKAAEAAEAAPAPTLTVSPAAQAALDTIAADLATPLHPRETAAEDDL